MFQDLSLPLNLMVFGVGAVMIWWAGTRLERLTDAIARRTGLGQAFAGLILLAAATSLPEVATTTTAVLAGNVELAVHNLLGGVAFQVVVLTIADTAMRRGPLTRFAPSFGLLIEGVGIVLLLGVAVCGLALAASAQFSMSAGPVTVGLNPVLTLLPPTYLAVIWLTRRAEGHPRWRPVDAAREDETGGSDADDERSGARLGMTFAAFAVVVLVGGWASASAADVMAAQTGLGSGFVGATLLAAATSLPEVSTTVSAVRHGNGDLAVSNVFGSNGFDVALLALVTTLAADAFSGGPAISAIFTAALGGVLTCVYLWGLLERSDRALVRVGVDSLVVVALYLAGMGALYGLG